jgi:hypothetical protein
MGNHHLQIVIGSSMAYVIVGFIYLSENDQVSNKIEEFEKGIILRIYYKCKGMMRKLEM